MIDIIRQTPHEYSAQSRDYQVLARLYTALYNYVKMYIDNLSIWDTNIDNKKLLLYFFLGSSISYKLSMKYISFSFKVIS